MPEQCPFARGPGRNTLPEWARHWTRTGRRGTSPSSRRTGKDPGARSTQQTKCHLAGTCICCETGKKLLKFRGLVLAALKAACPPDSPMRLMQAEGFLVCRLRSKATSKATALIAASFFGEAAEADSSDDDERLRLSLLAPCVAALQPVRRGLSTDVAPGGQHQHRGGRC